MRFDGRRAQGLALASAAGGNVVETGRAIDRRLAELIADLPHGIEIERIAWQSDEVSASVNGFLVNLAQAVGIVLLVLTIPMGWRMGVIIGSGLILTILGTFMVMSVLGVDLQRMSLGALVIALGMMVDNSIVVADGVAVRLQRGMDRRQAAIESAEAPSGPLLGATFVAVMAFYPVFASPADAGEYCRTLFLVVAISLMLSWLIAVTVTPLQCMGLLKTSETGSDDDPYGGAFYDRFRALLAVAIRRRFLVLGAMVALLAASLFGFRWIPQMFFPASSRPQLMIDYWGPEGSRIQGVSASLGEIERKLLGSEHVAHVATFVGQGPPRFYLPVDPEGRNPTYGQPIVNTPTLDDVDAVIAEIEPWIVEHIPDAMVRVRKYGVGPSNTWTFEARFSGPAGADPRVLRRIGSEGLSLLRASPLAKDTRTDLRNQVLRIVPDYHQTNARWASVTRSEIAQTAKRSFDGLRVGLYREGTDLHPILLRHQPSEREAAASNFELLQIQAPGNDVVPLSAVVSEIRAEWEDPIIVRSNRRRAVTVQGAEKGVTFATLRESVLEGFDEIPLPSGYELTWDGEQKSSEEGQAGLIPGVTPAVVVMLAIIVALFNAVRPPLIIVLTIPFMFIGITTGLLVTQAAFGFVALLGAMSLAGMMIKNSIVLLDQVGVELEEGRPAYQAVIDAAVSRLRPVMLAAATTVLGVIPLLKDLFWVSMSVTIMAGLAFGTVLVMVLVPVLYATLYGLNAPESVV
jgi:multidrug efflux pump subunit AcrB